MVIRHTSATRDKMATMELYSGSYETATWRRESSH